MAKNKFSLQIHFAKDIEDEFSDIVGKQQVTVIRNMIKEMNKFKPKTVMTILPSVMMELSRIVEENRVDLLESRGIDLEAVYSLMQATKDYDDASRAVNDLLDGIDGIDPDLN